MPESPFDIQKVCGARLGQNWPKRYLCEPTSVVTMVWGGSTPASAWTMSPGHIAGEPAPRSVAAPRDAPASRSRRAGGAGGVSDRARLALHVRERSLPLRRRPLLEQRVEHLRVIDERDARRQTPVHVRSFEDRGDRRISS